MLNILKFLIKYAPQISKVAQTLNIIGDGVTDITQKLSAVWGFDLGTNAKK